MYSPLKDYLKELDIPLWLLKKSPKYLLILGRKEQGSFGEGTEEIVMLKRLVQALNWDWSECVLDYLEDEVAPDAFIHRAKEQGIEKMILFGKNLSHFLGVDSPMFSKMVNLSGNIQAAMVPSVEALMTDPNQKREAWGCLKGF